MSYRARGISTLSFFAHNSVSLQYLAVNYHLISEKLLASSVYPDLL